MLQILFCFALLINAPLQQVIQIYSCKDGSIAFLSDATLETIRATSDELHGAVDISKRTFAFSVYTNTFQGFNSGLQKEHFNENYLETDKYPLAKFEGKLIEEVDLSKTGSYNVRAKGIFEAHGVKQERIIKANVEVKANSIHVTSQFTVLLDDHNIKIPRVVYQKISPEIQVNIEVQLNPYSPK